MDGSAEPRFFLILTNISKLDNIKKVMVSANAFGVSEVFVVGLPQLDLGPMCANAFGKHQPPSLGTSLPAESDVSWCQGLLVSTVPPIMFRRFRSLAACREYCQRIKCSICGIEILAAAEDVTGAPFRGDTAFMLGNEGAGLSERQIEACDHFVKIPHYGGGTASLNVAVAASIVMHRFAVWARCQHRKIRAGAFQYHPRASELYHPLPNAGRLQQAMGRKCEGTKPSAVTVVHGAGAEEEEVRFALRHTPVM